MFYENAKPQIIKVNPHKAERLLTLNNLSSQRPLRPALINLLASKIREGTFRNGEIATAVLKYQNNEMVLVNGQHQCHAIIMTGETVSAKYEEYSCETPKDLSILFRQFDTHGMRSLGDLVRIEADALDLKWPLKICHLIVSGASLKNGNNMYAHKTEKVEFLQENLEIGEFINYILHESLPPDTTTKDTAHLRRSPVITAMMLTYDKNQSISEKFWIDVRDGEGLKRSMPTYKLREFLRTSAYDRGRGALRARPVTAHEMTARCITAWNAYRKGESTSLKYFPNKPIPKAI